MQGQFHRRLRSRRSILRQGRHDRAASRPHAQRGTGLVPDRRKSKGVWFKARIANAVGTTQLTVSGNHGQPYLSGSKRTWRSAVRNFHFQNQFDSLPTQFMQPVEALQPGRYCWHQITKSHYSQRSDPATLLIVSGEDWPTAIRVLGAEQKVLSTFDVAYRRRAEDERGVARRLNCWLRRRCKSSPASTRELSLGKFS